LDVDTIQSIHCTGVLTTSVCKYLQDIILINLHGISWLAGWPLGRAEAEVGQRPEWPALVCPMSTRLIRKVLLLQQFFNCYGAARELAEGTGTKRLVVEAKQSVRSGRREMGLRDDNSNVE